MFHGGEYIDRFASGMLGYDRVHQELMDAVAAGKFQGLSKFITKKIALEDVVKEGIFSLLKEKDTQSES